MQANQPVNRLAQETSPYLLQHAHNPVDWYPWGEEALQLARDNDKPILVSIGYAACHWCHVMEKESFEDPGTAAIMNEYFVNIKIDREERPDLDHIYMDAVQAMTGSGGWPLNVFLMPDGRPFYGGTYFPPQPMHNRPSWQDVLQGVYKAYTEKKDAIDNQADKLTRHLQQSNAFGLRKPAADAGSPFTESRMETINRQLLASADREWGGFGAAPKFPQTQSIRFLLRHHHLTGDPASLEQAVLSLDKMIEGGIYDQLGGGLARYSTDTQWLAPHFEKMLYDNALLVIVLSEALQLTGYRHYERAIREILAFVKRELRHPEGGFYSALDADSEGVEGKFYTWSKAEVEAVLGSEAARFCAYYDITEAGNWEQVNILRILQQPAIFAAANGLTETELLLWLEEQKSRLMQRRAERIRPLLDDKCLLGWNALMITACCYAYAATGDKACREMAIEAMAFLEQKLQDVDGNWYHTYKAGKARIPAFLDDLAWLTEAAIALQEITGEGDYLRKAKAVLEQVNNRFGEENTGFYYYTPVGQEDVIIRKKEVYDGATPSGNAVMARNLQYLGRVFERSDWEERAGTMLGALAQAVEQYPVSFGYWALVLQTGMVGWKEIALMGSGNKDLLPQVIRKFSPWKIVQCGETKTADFPLLNGKTPKNGELVCFVCRDYTCSEYTTDKLADFLAIV